jgi:type I restriction enzyme S subunit
MKLARVTLDRCDGPFGSGLKSQHYSDEGVRVIRLQNIRHGKFDDRDAAFISPEYYRELGDHDVHAGDVLIAGLGDENNSVGRACVAPASIVPAMVKADCFRFRLDTKRANPFFVAYQLSSTARDLAGAFSSGTTRLRMNLTITSTRVMAMAPVEEQAEIVDELNEESAKLDALIAKVTLAIERLREYRTALISAAVTGKIDVRGHVEGGG